MQSRIRVDDEPSRGHEFKSVSPPTSDASFGTGVTSNSTAAGNTTPSRAVCDLDVVGGAREPTALFGNLAGDYRDNYAQRRYREQSESKYKDEKDVAHIVPNGMLASLARQTPGRKPVEQNRQAINTDENFQMVSTDTNRRKHLKLDAEILAATESKDKTLSAGAAYRALRQVKVLKNAPLSAGVANTAQNAFRGLRDPAGDLIMHGNTKFAGQRTRDSNSNAIGKTSNASKSSGAASNASKSSGVASNASKSSGRTSNAKKSSGKTSNSRKSNGKTSNSRKSNGKTSNSRKSNGKTSNSRKSNGKTSNSRKSSRK